MTELQPAVEYHEDMGPVLWYKYPIQEPPYCGTPLDDEFVFNYYTHFCALPNVTFSAHDVAKAHIDRLNRVRDMILQENPECNVFAVMHAERYLLRFFAQGHYIASPKWHIYMSVMEGIRMEMDLSPYMFTLDFYNEKLYTMTINIYSDSTPSFETSIVMDVDDSWDPCKWPTNLKQVQALRYILGKVNIYEDA